MAGFEKLLKNPEDYHVGDINIATYIVFPVEFGKKIYIVKKPRKLTSLINAAYVIQDKPFFETRRFCLGRKGLKIEAQKLNVLDDLKVPKFIDYGRGTLVREFLYGMEFKDLEIDDQKETLEEALQTLEAIHNRAIIVGDAHVKNIMRCEDGVYWFGFDGVFKEHLLDRSKGNGSKEYRSCFNKAKAIDLIKFVYSTYEVTENRDTLLYAAELEPRVYRGRQVKEAVSNLVNNFPLSLPDEKLDKEVRRILTMR